MRKNAFIFLVMFLVSIMNVSAFAQPPQISSGLTWLYSSQTSSGNWPEVTTTDYYSTVAALDAVYARDPSNPVYTAAFQWMSGQVVSPTDYLSRRIIALKRAGQDTSSELDGLLLYRNSDGAWGGESEYFYNILDTALALQALKTLVYSDYSVLFQAVSFITSNQNSDGGWGFAAGEDSNVFATAAVLKTLSSYNSVTFNVQSSLDKSVTYLLSKQNSDGGFGSSPSTVYDSGLALDALIASGAANITTVVSNGAGYLTTNQLSDGSWNEDPYSTALALRALASARSNLVIASSDISLSKPMPQENESITITAAVKNTGFDNASNIIVRFYLGDPIAGGTQIGTDQILPSLSVNSSSQVSITQSFTGTGGKTIFVIADPDNTISETSESDNKSSSRIWVATGPDLAVYSEDLKPSTYVPASGTAFTLEYKIRNLGESSADGFDVNLYDGDPNGATHPSPLQTVHISGLAGTETRTGSFGVTLSTDGQHTLYLVADAGGQITEISETNNTGTVTVNVGGLQGQVDLAVTSSEITLTPSRPTANQTVQISAVVRNQGYADAGSFIVDIYDNAPESGGTLIQSQTVSSLASGATFTATANVVISAGIHDLYVIVDRTNAISEADESNNTASVRVMTDMVDITISATDLSFTPSHPVSGDSVLLSVTVHNAGIRETGAFNLALYDGDPSAGGTLLTTYTVDSIQGDGTTTLPYTFTAIPWTYRFYAIADVESVVTELYEDNNQAIRSLKIKAPGEILGPDLVPTKIDLSALTTDPSTLSVSGTAAVTFQNKGDDKITSSFSVLVFEDTDLDGSYTPGLDNVLGTGTNSISIWPEGAGVVNVSLSGTVKFLHSPLYAYIDSADSIREQDETNNLLNSCADCEKRPENPIELVVKWKRTDIGNVPIVTPLIDTNGDGRADDKDIPALVFQAGNGLYALRGDTGATIWHYRDTANHPVSGLVAAGDLDGNGFPELVVPRDASGTYGTYSNGLVKFDHNGNLIWDNAAALAAWNASHGCNSRGYCNAINQDSRPLFADLAHDGKPEIIAGTAVVDSADGSIKWTGDQRYDFYKVSTVADLNLDGNPAIIDGYQAYNADGTLRWRNTSVPPDPGLNALARFGDDPYPAVVLERGTSISPVIYLLDHNGRIIWGPVNINTSNWSVFSLPVLADVDGDGETEILIKGADYFFALDKNGNVKQTYHIPGNLYVNLDETPTVFDLNGDGRPEALINANGYFRIFDGKGGTRLYEEYTGYAGGLNGQQHVIIADVDGDGQAEAVVAGGNGVSVYGSKNHDWVGSRRIWNQDDYHVANVNDDGTIPQYESPSWLLNNTFRTQARVGQSPNPYLTPNLTASYLRAQQNGASLNLTVRIGNGGAKGAAAAVTVTFYDGTPSSATVIGTASTTKALQPGEYQDLILSVNGLSEGLHHLSAVVDDSNAVAECNETDNHASLDFAIATGLPDLKVGLEDISLPAAPINEGSLVPITASVKNIGSLPASNVSVRLYNGNPSAGGAQVGPARTVQSINAAGSVDVLFTFDTMGKGGTNVLYAVIDGENSIVEASETNNTALFTLDVLPPQLPNLTITADAVWITPSSAREGEQVAISAIVTNRGASASNIPVRFYLGDPASGGTLVAAQTIYQILTLGQSAAVQATLDTTGRSGQQNVFVKVDPANTISESSEDDNIASKSLFVQSAGLAASMTLDKATYQANETAAVTITVLNSSGAARSLSLDLFVQDSAGNRIATVAQAEPVTIGLNSTATISKTWNVGKTLAGPYSVTAELSESGRVASRTSAGFTIAPDKRADAKVTTDKISYNPNETAAVTSVISSLSLNYIFENLTVNISMQDTVNSRQVYSETKTINTLMPGAAFTFKSYWNTGTNAAGTYPVTLEVKDASGTALSTSTQNLTISSELKPSVLLKGRISLDSQNILSGEPVAITYSATNVGNMDLSDVAFFVVIVDAASATVYDTVVAQAALSMGQTYTNTGQLDTANYSAKDYLVILRAGINGTEETLAGTYFRVEGAPTAPSLSLPANGSDVETLTPLLVVNNASDPNDDRLSYEFELYADSGLTNQAAGASGQGTGWTVPTALTENQTYYWRARAYDGRLYGEWMSAASFRVNTANDPPTAPTPASPVDHGTVDTLTPVLTVNNASDPDSGSLTYNFEVALDPDFTQLAASVQAVFSGQGTTSWQAPLSLAENTTYYWRARADDWLVEGPWMTAASFFVNTANDAPTAPSVIAPMNNSEVATLASDITAANGTDPDSLMLSYFFEVDTVMTFDSPNIIRSNSVAEGQGTTLWHVDGLRDNTQYYVRSKAGDGTAESPWSTVVAFFVNTGNDAPTAPTLANPSNGSGVSVFTPTLSVHDSTDPDRDVLTYEFEIYGDVALTDLVAHTTGVAETPQITSWTVPVNLAENHTYYWRARAFDGEAYGGWMPLGSFMVNTANDAPGAPKLHSPAEGSSLATLSPTLSIVNAVDPDSDRLSYDFEIYAGDALVRSIAGVPQDSSGTTSATVGTALSDNTAYRWRARAYDGDRYGAWMDMATFSIHIPVTTINATIDFDPDTLNKKSNGTWVVVYIELPVGYRAADIALSSIRFEGTVPAEARPSVVGDHDKDGTADLMVKFKRSEVINLLRAGEKVPVHVTGVVGTTTFEGVDIIRVIP